MLSMSEIDVLKSQYSGMSKLIEETRDDVKNIKDQIMAIRMEDAAAREKFMENFNNFKLDVHETFLSRESAEKKYASKISERIVYWMTGVILTSVLVGILTIVIK